MNTFRNTDLPSSDQPRLYHRHRVLRRFTSIRGSSSPPITRGRTERSPTAVVENLPRRDRRRFTFNRGVGRLGILH